MNLHIQNEIFLVLGATSGFGNSISNALLAEGARVIGVARNENKLNDMSKTHAGFEGFRQDIFAPDAVKNLMARVKGKTLRGVVVNAGGPPAAGALEAGLEQWDQAYHNVLRWKIELTKAMVPVLKPLNYARMVFIESASIRQPIENLVLSNSLRMAVAGFIKTLTHEMAESTITFNILAPGYHHTDAINRLISKKAQLQQISEEDALKAIQNTIPSKKLGQPDDFATLATWLLSPHSSYVNGQVFYLDGGLIKSNL